MRNTPRHHLATVYCGHAAILACILPLLDLTQSVLAAPQEQGKSAAPKTPEDLGTRFFEALRDADEQKLASVAITKEVADKVIASLPIPDEATKEKLRQHLAGIAPQFRDAARIAADFAKAQGFDWKTCRLQKVEAKTQVGRDKLEGFSTMTLTISIGDEKTPAITLKLDDGRKIDGVWYFVDAPLEIDLQRIGKSTLQSLRHAEKK